MNEKELKEVREILMDAYLNPGKYEAESDAVTLLRLLYQKKPEEYTEEDKRLLKLSEAALKGDKEAIEKLKNEFNKYDEERLIAVTDLIERIKAGSSALGAEERPNFYFTTLFPVWAKLPNITKEDVDVFSKLTRDEQLSDNDLARLDELFNNNKSEILKYHENNQKRLQSQPAIRANLNRVLLFIYLSIPIRPQE